MLIVHVEVHVRPERAADFLAATLVNAQASLAEPGVLRFDVLQDRGDPAHVVLTEVYRDDEASAADQGWVSSSPSSQNHPYDQEGTSRGPMALRTSARWPGC